jgi:hypothetical protein
MRVLIFLSSCLMVAAASDVFVSPAGSDTNAGTPASPFLTLQRAQQAVRAQSPLTADVSVYVRAGAYFQPAGLNFSAADSGSPSAVVRYVGGWPGDAPAPAVIHAGAFLTGWALSDPSKNIWSAPLPAGVADARTVWDSATGSLLPAAAVGGGLGKGAAEVDATGYTADAGAVPWLSAPAAQQNVRDVEFLFTGVGSSWTECRLRVESVMPLAGNRVNITMQQPAWSYHHRAYGQGLPLPVSSQNVFTALLAGQYYLNSATGTVYYIPVVGQDMSKAAFVVPTRDVLMEMRGSAGAPVQWITFSGLTFSYAGWIEPNAAGIGYVDMQSGYRIASAEAEADPGNDDLWAPVPGNLQLHYAQNVTFAGCNFTSLGATALAVLDSSQSVTVANNTFRAVSCSGVAVGQVSDVNTTGLVNGYFRIDSNVFDNIPVEFHDCAPILGGYVVGSNISNNAVLNASNGGICVGWGWSRDEARNSGWNQIVRNYVLRSNWLLEDCGSIYVLGPQPASLMAENFLAHQVKLFGALYTDEVRLQFFFPSHVTCVQWLTVATSFTPPPAPILYCRARRFGT